MNDLNKKSTLLQFAPLVLIPSGCAALIYQVAWVRLLGLSMGSTSAAVSTVLTAFFFGLAVGSYFAGKITQGKYTDLKTFVLLEIVIGISGLLLVPILLNLDYGMALLGESGTALSVKFITSMIILALPTICMGATFPLIASALIEQQDEMSSGLGKLYTLNTSGAVLGAILSGFLLIPQLGIDGAVYIACTLNLCAAIAGYLLYQQLQSHQKINQQKNINKENLTTENVKSTAHTPIVIVLFTTGFVSIASEVAWTKYLSIFTGATIYGFSAILGIFLIGIAMGSWATKHYMHSSKNTRTILIWGLISLAAALLFARVGLAQLPAFLEYSNHSNIIDGATQNVKYLVVFIVLFPATFIFGAMFPISLSLYCELVVNIRQRVGTAYAINTAGSIIGSLAAGFWIIPLFGTDMVLSSTIVIVAILPLLFINKQSSKRFMAFIVMGFVIAGSWQLPHIDYAKLIAANPYRFDSDAKSGIEAEFLFLKEGKAGVISLVTYDNRKAKLQNNGIQESYLSLKGGLRPPFTEVLLGLMPFLLHDDPKTAFVVGYGGGNTLQALADTTLEKIRVTELEPAVIDAVASIYDGKIPLLQDSRIELQINDARNTLLVENRKYDLIVSQPSHPWLAGAGNLFTKEFFQIVSENLNEGGIYSQWVNLFNMDTTTLQSIFKAYYEVFPHGFTFAKTNTGDLIMFGSKEPIKFNYKQIQQRMKIPAIKKALANVKVTRPDHLLWYFSLSRKEALAAAADTQANTDTRILSEVRLGAMQSNPEGIENPYTFLRQNYNLDVLSYFPPQEAGRFLYQAGRYFYTHSSTIRTKKAIEQLESVNIALAEQLEKKWLKWKENTKKKSK